MQSKVSSPHAYIEDLPEERKEAVQKIRDLMKKIFQRVLNML